MIDLMTRRLTGAFCDLIPASSSDTARKNGPVTITVHCLDTGVVVHARVDEPH
ncbi:hypothetical protein ACIBG4_00030 [Nonomuraea sp. NPDC050383]|uniref:hypothetical protein n=1 Tax=Nonomuraea sp. NPDC050383 TaxID=3364362 RepID=UPI0037A20E48